MVNKNKKINKAHAKKHTDIYQGCLNISDELSLEELGDKESKMFARFISYDGITFERNVQRISNHEMKFIYQMER